MKFQDDISNMNTYIHTDKPKPICPHFFKVGGINIMTLAQAVIEIFCSQASIGL